MNEAPLPRRIVAPLGRLADFGGRTRRADYWPYMLALMGLWLADLIVEIVLIPYRFGSPIVHGYALIAILLLLAFAATIRRLHDVGWSGRWMAAYVAMMLGLIAFALYWRYGIVHRPYGQQNIPLVRLMPLLMALGLAMDGLGLLVFILSLLDGTPGPNRYGPDPKSRSAA